VVALNQSDVHIWYRCTTSLDDEAVKSAHQHLSIEERARSHRLRLDADRRDFTIAHDLLRRSLSKYADIPPADWQFATNEFGKPSIENVDLKARDLSFSLSHTRGCVACAITCNAPLGVDVEFIDPSHRIQEIADRYFSEREAAWLSKSSDEVRNIRFAELWTLKEAFLKARGLGLSGSLTDVSFGFDEHSHVEIFGSPTTDPLEWHAALFEPVCNARLGLVIRSVAQPQLFMRQDKGDGRILDPIRASASLMKNNILRQV